MSDDPQAQPDGLIPVRYVGAEGLIVDGRGIAPGDVIHLPPEEVAQWPDPHPYYERADAGAGPTPSAPEAEAHDLAAAPEVAAEDAVAVAGSAAEPQP